MEFESKEDMIKNFLGRMDFKSDRWSITSITEGLKDILKETPGVDVSYKKDSMILEDGSKASIVEELEKITVVFSDGDKFKKVDVIVNDL